MGLFVDGTLQFPLTQNQVGLVTWRANNAKEVCDLGTQFLRTLDPMPATILEFYLTAGGGGDVDLTIALVPLDQQSSHPPTNLCRFVGREATDQSAFNGETNRILNGSEAFPPFSIVAGIAVATAATAGKVCAALLLVEEPA